MPGRAAPLNICIAGAGPYGAARLAMAIVSPCTKVCTIDPRSGLCLGCGRTLDEIGRWTSFGESERNRIMTELPQRRARHGIGAVETSVRESGR